MTPDQVQQVVHQALGLQPPWYVTVLLAAFVGSAVAYFSPYLGEKAKIRALQEDVSKLVDQARQTTRATEDIKVQIAAGLWVEQARWGLKRDIYSRLLESLGEFIWCQRLFAQGKEASPDTAHRAIGTLHRDIVRAHSTGRTFLSSRAFEVIALFGEQLERFGMPEAADIDTYFEVRDIAWKAFMVLAEEAGADLMALTISTTDQDTHRARK